MKRNIFVAALSMLIVLAIAGCAPQWPPLGWVPGQDGADTTSMNITDEDDLRDFASRSGKVKGILDMDLDISSLTEPIRLKGPKELTGNLSLGTGTSGASYAFAKGIQAKTTTPMDIFIIEDGASITLSNLEVSVKQEAARLIQSIFSIDDASIAVSSFNVTVPGTQTTVITGIAIGANTKSDNITISGSSAIVTIDPENNDEELKDKVAENTVMEASDYSSLVNALTGTAGTVRLTQDIVVEDQLDVTRKVTLDMNGKMLSNTAEIWDTAEKKWSIIAVMLGGDLTIKGNGKIDAKENDCYALDVRDEGTHLLIENGEFIGNVSAVYAHTGNVEIAGGTFSIKQRSGYSDFRYLLNLLDDNGKAGKATISVTGGSFKGFDPADNLAEDPKVSFVAEGYEVSHDETDDIYTVSMI